MKALTIILTVCMFSVNAENHHDHNGLKSRVVEAAHLTDTFHTQQEMTNIRNFPCPFQHDISPCNCTVLEAGLEMTCENVESHDKLESIFAMEFPVKKFNRLMIFNSPELLTVGNILNGVTFQQVILQSNGISWMSDYFLYDSLNTLEALIVRECELVSETFPFITLGAYSNLTQLTIDNNLITWIPVIQSDSLEQISFTNENIAIIEPGTFDKVPNVKKISLRDNNITTLSHNTFSNKLVKVESINLMENNIEKLVAGTFQLPFGIIDINLRLNNIAEIEPQTFLLPALTYDLKLSIELDVNDITELDQDVFGYLWPYLDSLSLSNNPLNCGCDMAWIVLHPYMLSTISNSTHCADGRTLYELDPDYYETYC